MPVARGAPDHLRAIEPAGAVHDARRHRRDHSGFAMILASGS
jgi:hypothetical protein